MEFYKESQDRLFSNVSGKIYLFNLK